MFEPIDLVIVLALMCAPVGFLCYVILMGS